MAPSGDSRKILEADVQVVGPVHYSDFVNSRLNLKSAQCYSYKEFYSPLQYDNTSCSAESDVVRLSQSDISYP
uniref:TMEM132D_N domain-containing protein n=1 Tax=Heterorhabditis bacteriophora TaxID=37862 RepID=A0A1I7WW47_HETBA